LITVRVEMSSSEVSSQFKKPGQTPSLLGRNGPPVSVSAVNYDTEAGDGPSAGPGAVTLTPFTAQYAPGASVTLCEEGANSGHLEPSRKAQLGF
jgi:hypothetical protein